MVPLLGGHTLGSRGNRAGVLWYIQTPWASSEGPPGTEAHRTDIPPIGRRQPRYEGQRLQGVALPFDKLFSFLISNKHCTKNTKLFVAKDLLFLFCFFLVKSCLDKSFSQTNVEAQHWSNMGVLKIFATLPYDRQCFPSRTLVAAAYSGGSGG